MDKTLDALCSTCNLRHVGGSSRRIPSSRASWDTRDSASKNREAVYSQTVEEKGGFCYKFGTRVQSIQQRKAKRGTGAATCKGIAVSAYSDITKDERNIKL